MSFICLSHCISSPPLLPLPPPRSSSISLLVGLLPGVVALAGSLEWIMKRAPFLPNIRSLASILSGNFKDFKPVSLPLACFLLVRLPLPGTSVAAFLEFVLLHSLLLRNLTLRGFRSLLSNSLPTMRLIAYSIDNSFSSLLTCSLAVCTRFITFRLPVALIYLRCFGVPPRTISNFIIRLGVITFL